MGWATGSRRTLIVPKKLANRRPREPVEGSGVPDHRTVEGEHNETLGSDICHRNFNG